jgi:hypothetical protein
MNVSASFYSTGRVSCELTIAILGGHLHKVEFLDGGRIEMFSGQPTSKLRVIGWNINLQSSFGALNAEITVIGQRVAQLAKR